MWTLTILDATLRDRDCMAYGRLILGRDVQASLRRVLSDRPGWRLVAEGEGFILVDGEGLELAVCERE